MTRPSIELRFVLVALVWLLAGSAGASEQPAPASEGASNGPIVEVASYTPDPKASEWRRRPGRRRGMRARSIGAEVARKPAGPYNPDPWETVNRGLFAINEYGDIWILTPIAKGWLYVTPGFFRTAVSNFNANLEMPVVLGNNLLQLKPKHVGQDFLRFFYDTTFGIGGLIDFATMIDIPQNDEDFGQTMGYWGIPSGPYVVLPLFGPSTVRGGVGRVADSAGTLYFSFLPFYSTLLVRGIDIVNLRSYYIEEIDENRRESFDYYVFMRNAYLQNRRSKIGRAGGGTGAQEPDEDLYYFDDDEEDVDYDEEAG